MDKNNFLEVQWLRFCTSNTGGVGLVPVQGTKNLQDEQCDQKKGKKQNKTKQRNNSPLPPAKKHTRKPNTQRG